MEKEHSKTGNSGQLPANPEAVEVEELDIEELVLRCFRWSRWVVFGHDA
jgi:hypothetical protein